MKRAMGPVLALTLLAGVPAQAAPVNINDASAEEIAEALRGVGIKRAQQVVDFREKHGRFRSVEQLREVKGFGGKTFDRNRHDIRLHD